MDTVKRMLVAVVVLAAALRLAGLDRVPASPDWDEVAFGYNAYSILKTGRDEFGVRFPLAFKSFGEYKTPLYIYASVPVFALFGMNLYTLRLFSAVSGIAGVVAVFYLTRFLVSDLVPVPPKKGLRMHSPVGNAETIALTASFLLAVSPWHLQFSRVAFESMTAIVFLNTVGTLLFLKGMKKPVWLLAAAASFAVPMYGYHGTRVFTPLLVLYLALTHVRTLLDRSHIRYSLAAAAVGLLILLPVMPILTSDESRQRLLVTTPFAHQKEMLARTFVKLDADIRSGDPLGRVFDNRRIVWATQFMTGYLSHFSLGWLFVTGDNPRHHAPDMGLMYLFELPFFLYGLYRIAKAGGNLRTVVLGWMLLAPIPAAPTNELPHGGRTVTVLPMLQIATAVGAVGLVSWWRTVMAERTAVRRTGVALAALAAVVNIGYYAAMYVGRYNMESAPDFQYGLQQAAAYTEAHKASYDKIVVSSSLEQPHIFFLFFTGYDPAKYLAGGGTMWDQKTAVQNRFDKYEFRAIDWKTEQADPRVLYVGKYTEMPPGNRARIAFPNGRPAVEISVKQ